MRIQRLENFTGGWLVGNFLPSLLRQPHVEVAIKHYQPRFVEKAHVHDRSTEATVIVYGRVRLGPLTLLTGDVLILDPGEPMPGDWVVVEPSATCCIKFPSVRGDKRPVV